MPRSKKKSKGEYSPVEFIRYNLTAEDKKALEVFAKKPPQPIEDLMKDCLQANHKVSYSYNETNDNYIVSVTGKPEECDNASKCFTSYAKDPVTALWVAMYKYHVVWERGVWESLDEGSDFG